MSRKTLLLSSVLPPSPYGQGVVLYNLLREAPPEDYALVGNRRYDEGAAGSFECTEGLRSPYYSLPLMGERTRKVLNTLFVLGVRAPLEHYLLRLSRELEEILKKERCTQVVVCTGDLYDPIVAMMLSRRSGVPCFLYVFDDYREQWVEPKSKAIAQRFEPEILARSAGVIVTNEALRDRIEKRVPTRTNVIYNPVDLARYPSVQSGPPPPGDEFRIVYTGSIYEAQADAIVDLAQAIAAMPSVKVVLDLYTNADPGYLRPLGLEEMARVHPPVHSREIPALQTGADLLFLPLSFESPYSDALIETSLPGKTGEYLASGRPIIVYAPERSFIARYFRENDCGLVVDTKDWHLLAEEIEAFLQDPERMRRMSRNARRCAERDFDLTLARDRLLSALS